MISTVYKFDFFLGIKNTKLEIRNALSDETKAETKSYYLYSVLFTKSLCWSQDESTQTNGMLYNKPAWTINFKQNLFLTTMLFPICSELFQNSDAFIEATSSRQ